MEDPVRMRPPGLMADPAPMGHPDRTWYLALREPQDRTQVPDRMRAALGRTRPRGLRDRTQAQDRREPMVPGRSEDRDQTEPEERVAPQDRMVPRGPTHPRGRRATQDRT